MEKNRAPLISVIIPTYNVSNFIELTLSSVLNQSYNNIEIIIIDDGSTDDTLVKIREINSEKIILVRKEHSGNVGRNLNEGIEIAQGEYIAILGADDYWDEKKLEKQIKFIKESKLICSNAKIIDESGNIISERFFENINDNIEIDITLLLKTNFVIASSAFGEKKVFQKYGGFEQELGIRGEDYYLWLNIAYEHNIKFINEPLVYFRMHGDNLSLFSAKERINVLENTIKIRKMFLTGYNDRIVSSAKRGIISALLELCKFYNSEGNYECAISTSKRLVNNYLNRFSYIYFKILLFFILLNVKKFFKEVLD